MLQAKNKKSHLKTRITVAALLLVGSQITWAQRGGQAPDPAVIFANWDANDDGSITEAKFNDRPRMGGSD